MWLDNAIIEGLQTLLVLRLKDAPASDTIASMAQVWIQVFKRQPIVWNEATDAERIRHAFVTAAGCLDTWPSPKTVLTYLPRHADKLKIEHQKVYKMPDNIKAVFRTVMDNPPRMTAEQIDQELARLRRS